MYKSQEDYVKEIADRINSGKCYELENPTKKDILKLKDFDYILTNGEYFPIIIRKKYIIETVLNIPTVMWGKGYEIGDSIMGMIPTEYSADEVLEELKGFKGELS